MNNITDAIERALKEDILNGDITTKAVIPPALQGTGKFVVKQDGVAAGLEIGKMVFEAVDPSLKYEIIIADGSLVKKGDVIAEVKGSASSILTAERTALNFMQRMSGIATTAKEYSDKVKHTKAKIIDTRKTVPGLRALDKLAVTFGGCQNHRIGLFDMFLIKDNHIEIAGSIAKAIEACRTYNKQNNTNFKIEVEVDGIEQIEEALSANPDIILLDNFTPEQMKEAVKLINGKSKTEASGGITLANVKEAAESGVDYISIGALTHSVKALDISLDIILNK